MVIEFGGNALPARAFHKEARVDRTYVLPDIGPGTYTIRSFLLTGYNRFTSPSSGAYTVVLSSGGLAGSRNFGVQ